MKLYLTILFYTFSAGTSAVVSIDQSQRMEWDREREEIEQKLRSSLGPGNGAYKLPEPTKYTYSDPNIKKYYEDEENPNTSDQEAIGNSAGKVLNIFDKILGDDSVGNGSCPNDPTPSPGSYDEEKEYEHDFGSGTGDLKMKGTDAGDGEQVIVNECQPEGGLSFKYYEGCNSKQKVDKQFYEFFNNNFSKCVGEAAKVQGVTQISIVHAGITGDSNHTSKSMHATNRAIDIKSVAIKDSSGNEQTFNANSQDGFFTGLRNCWHNAMVSQVQNCPGSQPKGSIGEEDHNHKHHVHLSLPYCPQIAGKNVK